MQFFFLMVLVFLELFWNFEIWKQLFSLFRNCFDGWCWNRVDGRMVKLLLMFFWMLQLVLFEELLLLNILCGSMELGELDYWEYDLDCLLEFGLLCRLNQDLFGSIMLRVVLNVVILLVQMLLQLLGIGKVLCVVDMKLYWQLFEWGDMELLIVIGYGYCCGEVQGRKNLVYFVLKMVDILNMNIMWWLLLVNQKGMEVFQRGMIGYLFGCRLGWWCGDCLFGRQLVSFCIIMKYLFVLVLQLVWKVVKIFLLFVRFGFLIIRQDFEDDISFELLYSYRDWSFYWELVRVLLQLLVCLVIRCYYRCLFVVEGMVKVCFLLVVQVCCLVMFRVVDYVLLLFEYFSWKLCGVQLWMFEFCLVLRVNCVMVCVVCIFRCMYWFGVNDVDDRY